MRITFGGGGTDLPSYYRQHTGFLISAAIDKYDASVDYHVSSAVFEHIPLNVLKDILEEGNRIVKKESLFIHNIDYGDHFKNIAFINFLQYSDKEWRKVANNKHAYVNRLRHDDFMALFESSGHETVEIAVQKDQHVKELLKGVSCKLDQRIKPKGNDMLSIIDASFVTRKSRDVARHVSTTTPVFQP
jgi:hypothetical protein